MGSWNTCRSTSSLQGDNVAAIMRPIPDIVLYGHALAGALAPQAFCVHK